MRTRGFTLVELLIAISIIDILSVIGLSVYEGVQKSARDAKRKTDLRSIKIALELYKQTNGSYPTSNSNWIYSSASNPWIPQLGFSYFPNGIPVDPLNTGTSPNTNTNGYVYGYWSGDTSVYSGCTTNGFPTSQFFALVVQLENKSDSDNLTNKQYKWCDGKVLTEYGWLGSSFVITAL